MTTFWNNTCANAKEDTGGDPNEHPAWFASVYGGTAVTEDGFPTDSHSSTSGDEEDGRGRGAASSPSSSSLAGQQKQQPQAEYMPKNKSKLLILAIGVLLIAAGSVCAGLAVAFRFRADADGPTRPSDDADTFSDSMHGYVDDADATSDSKYGDANNRTYDIDDSPTSQSDDADTDSFSESKYYVDADAGRLENWRFVKGDDNLRLSQDPASWEKVIVPHSWNVHDGQDGGNDYYRGPGWYQHALTIADYHPRKRYFLRFQAVGTVATVYVNSVEVGHHEGGYTAFTVEITNHISGGNGTYDLRVLADNSYRDDVMPLSGDFTVAGGIHRPVDLVVKEAPICFSQLDDASQGVRIFQENVSEELASLRVNVVLDGTATTMQDDEAASIVVTLKDATDTTVASDTVEVLVPPGNTLQWETILSIDNPHLWHGIEDPYHYTLTVSLLHQRQVVDRYTKKVGFRFVHIDPKEGFYLNGKPFPLRGVNMHYDHQDMGAALTDEQVREDFALVRELGANSVRLAHYPHAALSHELCDELGLLVWAEIPLVNEMRDTPEFSLNARQQLLEMIKQLGNHHSIYTWGLTNEMFQKTTDDPFDLLRSLDDLSKETDPSRFTIQATNRNRDDLNTITDTYGVNYYPGWYGTDPHGMMGGMTRYNERSGNSGLSIAEYGAGASILHQSQDLEHVEPKGKWHPEQWQAYLHESQYSDIVQYQPTWSSYIWLMFDFSSDKRDEGDRSGVNDKGLITHDHSAKKDAFYFYQANWRKDLPIVHLTSKRHVIRTEGSTPVKVYANVPEVELFVNGVFIGFRRPNNLGIAQWENINLKLGENTILVKDTASDLVDGVVWTYNPDATVITKESSSTIVEGIFRASDAGFHNGPSKAFDGNPETRWASNKVGAWISRELENEMTLSGISILWFGTGRSYQFQVETSMDGNTWRLAYAGNSSASRRGNVPESYTFGETEQARHIRITCYGSNRNNWSSIREVTLVTGGDSS